MESLKGIAHKVDSTVIEYARSKYSKRTVHITSFQIAGRQVKYESTRRQMINEGDKMIVIGTVRGKILFALAYKNLTSGIENSQGWFVWLFLGLLFGSVGFFIWGLIDIRTATVGQIVGIGIFGGVFCVFSALQLFVGIRTLQALNYLRKEAL